MKLTDGEKLVVAILSDIHSSLNIKGDVDIERIKSSLYGGHLWSLKWDMGGLFESHEDSPEVVEETVDFLDMWSLIERSFEHLTQAEQDDVRKSNYDHDPKFPGFDANNEQHFGVASHLIGDMGRWNEFQGRGLNSHSQKIASYRKMHEVFEPTRSQLANRQNHLLNKDELIAILNPH